MKRLIVIALTTVLLGLPVHAQKECKDKEIDKKALQEKIMKKKQAAFTENLKLDKEEFEKFWPLYQEYETAKFEIMERKHKTKSEFKKKDLLSVDEKTANELIDMEIKMNMELADIKRNYYEKFKSVLPPQKVAKLIFEEHEVVKGLNKERKKERIEKKGPEEKQKMKAVKPKAAIK